MTGWLFLLPELAGVLVFGIIPFLDVVRRSFFRMADQSFVGFSNYREMFANDAFRLAAGNTVKFVLTCIPLLLVLSLFIAFLLQEQLGVAKKKRQHRDIGAEQYYRKKTAILKSAYLMPMAIPAAGVAVLWKLLFDSHGFLNGLLTRLHMETADWMNTGAAFGILVSGYLWKYLGYDVILWLAGFLSIPESIFEAAKMDGAGKWQIFCRITLPNLKTVAFTVVILSVLNSFKAFREVYMVAGNYPQESIYLLQHVFNNWFLTLSVDKMAAASVLLALVIAGFVLLLQRSWERRE